MKTAQTDVFGIAFQDYFLKKRFRAMLTVDTDIAETEKLPVSYFFRSFGEMPEIEQIALRRCCGRILDGGAGAGAHALWLQDKGFSVTAIDISPGAVEVMKLRGVENAICSDLNSLAGEKFDTILLLMNGIGIAQHLKGLLKFVANAGKLLNPGGKILLDSTDISYLFKENDGSMRINLSKMYCGEVDYAVSYKKHGTCTFKWLFVDYDTLAGIARKCNVKISMIDAGLNGNYLAELLY
ncbi:MAG: methyltransferase domain-containing protein [Bacteroidetes bacterium]|nr:methyltransferase domain-containing protein [Bacteroidota bacterium]MBU1719296.1 methyltransferase domain-containing protein [Bacteroidota bacterium]